MYNLLLDNKSEKVYNVFKPSNTFRLTCSKCVASKLDLPWRIHRFKEMNIKIHVRLLTRPRWNKKKSARYWNKPLHKQIVGWMQEGRKWHFGWKRTRMHLRPYCIQSTKCRAFIEKLKNKQVIPIGIISQ